VQAFDGFGRPVRRFPPVGERDARTGYAPGPSAIEEYVAEEQKNYLTYASGILAVSWAALAWFNPENTYHLFPLVIAGALPVSYRAGGRPPLSWPAGLGAAVGGLINVALITILLTVRDKLEGPSLLSFGDAAVEAIIFAMVGGLAGAVFAVKWTEHTLRRR
jgi:hypothetical protein